MKDYDRSLCAQIKNSYDHDVYTKEVNKIALSSNDDKRLQTFNRITIFPHGTSAVEVCESEMMMVKDYFFKNTQIVCFMMKQYQNDKDKRLSKYK